MDAATLAPIAVQAAGCAQGRLTEWTAEPMRPSAGNMGLLDAFVPEILAGGAGNSAGLRASTVCAEEIPFSSLEEAIAAKEGLNPTLTEPIYQNFSRYLFEVCEFWEVTPRPEIDSQPVVSDIPTLILAGQYDHATPPTASSFFSTV